MSYFLEQNYQYLPNNKQFDLINQIDDRQGRLFNTPLHLSVSTNQVKTTKMLIDLGVNLDKPNYLGDFPLDMSKKDYFY